MNGIHLAPILQSLSQALSPGATGRWTSWGLVGCTTNPTATFLLFLNKSSHILASVPTSVKLGCKTTFHLPLGSK